MMTRTVSWLVMFTIAMAALWSAPAHATGCDEEMWACLESARQEANSYVRETLESQCIDQHGVCLQTPVVCGDYYCGDGEDHSNCPSDCY